MEKSVSFLELVSTGSCRTGSFNTKGQRKYCHSHRWVAIVSSQKMFIRCPDISFCRDNKVLSCKQHNSKTWTHFSGSLGHLVDLQPNRQLQNPQNGAALQTDSQEKLLVANQALQPTSDLNKHAFAELRITSRLEVKKGDIQDQHFS